MLRWLVINLVLASGLSAQGSWEHFQLPKTVSLRGIGAVSDSVCWVSGDSGTVYLTRDAGKSWLDVSPSGVTNLDFRDIEAFGESTAAVVSAGFPSYILSTYNAGESWVVEYNSFDKRVFLDAMDFWDNKEGMVFGDAIGREIVILRTRNGAQSWFKDKSMAMPDVFEDQGGFAASGSCLQTFGNNGVVIGLGGPEATLLLSHDRGANWIKKTSPLDAGSPSAGIFTFSFIDSLTGLCAGGDYTGDSATGNSIALTHDGGLSWRLISHPEVNGFYHSSCLMIDQSTYVAISRFGSSWSFDAGKTWFREAEAYYSLSRIDNGFWASGAEGRVGRWLKEH